MTVDKLTPATVTTKPLPCFVAAANVRGRGRSTGESDDSYHAIVPWNLTICTTAREGAGG